ncbi:MAG TPA: flagellar biosynthetic protein FliQ [Candidatus Eremiobacteraceae bacterium]|nr:flagellar biosynthetic protein FliQ [Candidatus Eremiobacteraceae bacterium]
MDARGFRARRIVQVIPAAAAAQALFAVAMKTAALIALPTVAAVAAVGVAVGIIQTIVQVQDQNVSFLPKLLAVGMMAAAFGGLALAELVALFQEIARVLPAIARY